MMQPIVLAAVVISVALLFSGCSATTGRIPVTSPPSPSGAAFSPSFMIAPQVAVVEEAVIPDRGFTNPVPFTVLVVGETSTVNWSAAGGKDYSIQWRTFGFWSELAYYTASFAFPTVESFPFIGLPAGEFRVRSN